MMAAFQRSTGARESGRDVKLQCSERAGCFQESDMSVNRRWNLNEQEGRYASTNLVEPVILVDLGLKRVNGDTERIGRFRLDLESLAAQGVVARRKISGNRVFDVQIYRDEHGDYSLGVRRDHTIPLAPHRIP